MKIMIVTDAWEPQVNGVVRTLEETAKQLVAMGHDVRVVGPDANRLFVLPLPTYSEIKLEFFAHRRLKKIIADFSPDVLHIATEGPLGWAMRRLCLRQGRAFTTSYQSNFPDFLVQRVPRVLAPFVRFAAFAFLRRFHAPSGAVMVPTSSVENELRARGFLRLVRWPRGVDVNLFKPYGKDFVPYKKLRRPILLYVGRIAVEKNLRVFLDLRTAGSKVVIGDGPDLKKLRRDYPQADFLGALAGEELARAYAAADLFVFPSKTDTFGLVLLEACAAGLRVAAYPAPGPRDVFSDEKRKSFAVLDDSLQKAVEDALFLPDRPELPRSFAAGFSWKACTEIFLEKAGVYRQASICDSNTTS